MSYGKKLYREKFKQTMEYLEEIERNYFNLDDEYQFISKRIEKAIEYIEHYLEEDRINCGNIYHSVYDELLDILKGSDSNEQ